jgi:bifunctional non-homologous end joining protein LigD
VGKLHEYRTKRDARATREPLGGDPSEATEPTRRGAFVVHLHDATRTHYDLRIEAGGVLASFAVPRGPSLDPDAKHLAVRTEDHPLEYLDFEDVIPDGQYGAGPMIVWDRGRIEYLEGTFEEGLARGKIDFALFGHKLRGRWALVRLKKTAKEWLLLKKRDAFAAPGDEITRAQPRSVLSALAIDELARARELGAALEARCAERGAPLGEVDALRIAPAAAAAWTDATSAPRGAAWTHEVAFGGVRVLAAKTDADAVIARGGGDLSELYPEIARAVRALAPGRVVLDGELVALGDDGAPSPARLSTRGAALDAPIVMLVSDLLAVGARDLRTLPLSARRRLLGELLPSRGVLRVTTAFDDDPAPLIAFCRTHALAGVLSRRADAPYPAGGAPSAAWTHLTVTAATTLPDADEPPPPTAPPTPRPVAITNPHKVFWPEEGYTKGDLVAYYEAIAPAILPYLRDRPIAVVRYPDGIHGKSFYQWNVPPGMPRWMGSFALRDDGDPHGAGGDKRVFLVNDAPSLAYVANLACIPLHILACRKDSLDACDFLTIEFDLKLARLEHAVAHALTLRGLLAELGLEGLPKTSGQSGLHVLVPLGPGATFAAARALAELLGQLVVRAHPDTATMERIVKKRGDKVYVDTGQTGPTRTIAAPYSVRAQPGATVSTPLTWDEVTPALDPKRFTLRTVPARFAERGDPMRPLLTARPDVARAVRRVERLVTR